MKTDSLGPENICILCSTIARAAGNRSLLARWLRLRGDLPPSFSALPSSRDEQGTTAENKGKRPADRLLMPAIGALKAAETAS